MFKKIFIAAAIIVLSVSSMAMAAPKYSLKIGHESAPDSMMDHMAKTFKAYVEKESKGQIQVSIFPSNQVGDPFAVLQGMQTGVVEMGILNGGSVATVLKDFAIFSVPEILPKDSAKNMKVFAPGSPFVKRLVANSEKTGIKFLGIYVEPFFQVTANKKIQNPADFKGLKIRTMNSPIILATYKALGANPTPIPFSEVYSGLQTNMIDGQENPLDIIYEMSYFEVQKYLMETNHSTVVNMLYISSPLFSKMPRELQDIVVKGGQVSQEYMFKYVPKLAAESREKLAKTGKIEMVASTPEISAAYKKAAEAAKGEYFKLVGEKEGKEIFKSLEETLKSIK